MDILIKAIACALMAAVLSIMLPGNRKEHTLLLGIAASCMVGMTALVYLQPVIDLLKRFQQLGDLNVQMIGILFKVVGIGLVTEMAALVCKDAGNDSLGKMIHILGTVAILWITIPLFEEFIALIEDVLKRI